MTLGGSRLCLVVSAVLFFVAALLLVVHAGGDAVEPLALGGFGFWALSGAV